jgi:riboflavin biosynthesis pyrimidine reductase
LASVADVVTVGQVSIDVDAATQALVERGLPRILCEGGPHVLAYFVEADRLDELCYTITPTMVGGRSARLMETPQSLTSRWQLAHIVEDDGTLLTRWIRAASPTSSSAT